MRNIFGTESEKGSIYQSAENAIQFYKDQDMLEKDLKADDVINGSFLQE